MRTQAVYQIKNSINGKVYVGSSVGVERRWNMHLKALKSGSHHSCILQREWEEHGEDCFSFSLLEKVQELSALRAREKFWIKNLDSVRCGYNRIYDTEVKSDKSGLVKKIFLDKKGIIVVKSLSHSDKKELLEVGQAVFLRQLRVRGYKVELRVKKVKKRGSKSVKSCKNSGPCLVWANNPKPYIIRSGK